MAKPIKGGYKNVSLKGVDLVGNSPVVDGLYDALINSYDKPIQLCNIIIDGAKKKNAFVQVKKDGNNVVVENLYGYKLTIDSDNAIEVGQAIPSKLYKHSIKFSFVVLGLTTEFTTIDVITNDATPYTLQSIKDNYSSLSFMRHTTSKYISIATQTIIFSFADQISNNKLYGTQIRINTNKTIDGVSAEEITDVVDTVTAL